MTIWSYVPAEEHDPWGTPVSREAADSKACLYCREDLIELRYDEQIEAPHAVEIEESFNSLYWHRESLGSVDVCPTCGWWKAISSVSDSDDPTVAMLTLGNFGILKQLDLTDLNTPLDLIRTYLLAKYDQRFELHPRLLEETVAAVMTDFGFSAQVTAYSCDGGVDIVLQRTDGTTIGVQVKQYQNRIKVAQIRELMGALILKGLTRGVFVTTSTFQPGAATAASQSSNLGLPIELVDADRF